MPLNIWLKSWRDKVASDSAEEGGRMLVVNASSQATARPALPKPPAGTRKQTRAALILGAIGMAVGAAGSWIPSYWGDEAASVMSATRSWSSLGAMLLHVDGVHGVYYAALHLWVDVFGTSEFATRFPSAIAVGLMVSGTVVLAGQFTQGRITVVAGIICLVLPRTTYMASEARSYALGAAIAVWATVLLVRLARGQSRRRAWAGYALVLAGAMYVFLCLGLLIIVHAAYLGIRHRGLLRRWSVAACAALLLAGPILAIGFLERQQISFLARYNYATAGDVVTEQWFGYPALAVVCWVLILCAVVVAARVFWAHRGSEVTDGRAWLTLLCLLWLVIPTALLLIANVAVAPVYNSRYLSFCAPAAAILVALGITAVASAVGTQRWIVALLVGAFVLACVPVYLGQRTAWAKDDGSDLRAVADYVHRNAASGDVVVFDQTAKPSRNPRLGLDVYPEDFSGLQDVELQTPFEDRAGLWDAVYLPAETAVQLDGNSAVWAIELLEQGLQPDDIVRLESVGYRVISAQLIHRTTVYHLVRP